MLAGGREGARVALEDVGRGTALDELGDDRERIEGAANQKHDVRVPQPHHLRHLLDPVVERHVEIVLVDKPVASASAAVATARQYATGRKVRFYGDGRALVLGLVHDGEAALADWRHDQPQVLVVDLLRLEEQSSAVHTGRQAGKGRERTL